MNILFYSAIHLRSRDTESVMLALQKKGHKVFSLSLSTSSASNDFLSGHGIKTKCFVPKSRFRWIRHLESIIFLASLCSKRSVDIVYSHLEPANFIAAITQYVIKARVFICRHHSDQYHLLGLDKDFSYWITYRLARRIIVYSASTRKFMIAHERVPAEKITWINLGYDFALYPPPRKPRVEEIKTALSSGLILITVGALTPLKRPEISIKVLNALVTKGYDAKLLLLGRGELDKALRSLAAELGLENRLLMTGYVDNVLEYIASASFLLHPSVSEASCVVIKEAALVQVPIIVTKHVGDFDGYLVHGQNGFLVDREKFVEESVQVIESVYPNKQRLGEIGANLRTTLDQFGVEKVIDQYEKLNYGH